MGSTIYIKINKNNLPSLNYEELLRCAKDLNKEHILEMKDVLRLPVWDTSNAKVVDCILNKLDENDKLLLELISKNMTSIIINGFKQGRPIIDIEHPPPKDYWKVHSNNEITFWKKYSDFIIKRSEILFID